MREEIIGEKIARIFINRVGKELDDQRLQYFINNNDIDQYKWLGLKMLIKNVHYKNLHSYIEDIVEVLEKYL